MNITTPDQVIAELNRLKVESERGITALYDAEVKVADRDLAWTMAYNQHFLDSKGTVADRESVAKMNSANEKFELDMAKIELSRIKAKIKQLSDAGTLTAVIAKQVELTYKH